VEALVGWLELGLTHAGWPFICFEISDGWVRARMFRTTIRLASCRRVEINPDPQFDPDMGRVLDPITYFSFEIARGLFRTTTKVALRYIIKQWHLTRPRGLIAFSRQDEYDADAESNPVFSISCASAFSPTEASRRDCCSGRRPAGSGSGRPPRTSAETTPDLVQRGIVSDS
jgi:hypothetical protein